MKTLPLPFTEQEQAVRKNWLRLFIATNICIVLFYILDRLVMSSSSAPLAFTTITDFITSAILEIGVVFLMFLVLPYPLYNCAYKKQGNIYLTLTIILCIVIFLYCTYHSLFIALSPIHKFRRHPALMYEVILEVVLSVLQILWIFWGLKLRKINKQYRIRSRDCERDYEEFTLRIQIASSREVLDSWHFSAVQAQPQFKDHFYREYLKRKEELSKAPPSLPS